MTLTLFFPGHKFSVSFDEATFIGMDRYLTLNLHHSTAIFGKSKIAPLGLVRVKESASGVYLQEILRERLKTLNLSEGNLLAAATDAGSNVLRAVHLIGLRRQKCFAHGLDLVVRKALFGKKPRAFDISIFDPDEEDDKVSVSRTELFTYGG